MSNEYDWVNFTRRTDDPKLAFIEAQLATRNIPTRRNGHSFYGPILQVPREFLTEAWDFLQSPIGEFYFGTNAHITWDDLPDDHEAFGPNLFGVLASQTTEYEDDELGLEYTLESYPDVTDNAPVRMYNVDSSNTARIGFSVARITSIGEFWLYAQFTGGECPYRYYPLSYRERDNIIHEIQAKHRNEPNASVGSLFHREVKVRAETGELACQKLVDGEWRKVATKAERFKK